MALLIVWTHYNSSDRGRNSKSFPPKADQNNLLALTSSRLIRQSLCTELVYFGVASDIWHIEKMLLKQLIDKTVSTDSVPTTFWLNLDLKIKIVLSEKICYESMFLYCPLKMALLLWRRQTVAALWSALSEESWAYVQEFNETDWGKLHFFFFIFY